MKNLLVILFVWFGFPHLSFCEFHPSYDPNEWPKHIIKLSAEGTLKDIFDAGIRPYRFPSLEKSSLGFKHVRVSFETKSGERLPELPVEWGDLDLLKDGLLSSIEMTSPNLSIQEAEIAMVPFIKNGKRTIEHLKVFLTSAAADPRNYDDPYNGDPSGFDIVWNDVGGPNYVVFFKSTFTKEKPVSIALKVSFFPIRTVLQERSFYNIPIPPPPGYENISMDAPRNFGPDSAVEIARSKGLSITGDRTPEEYEKKQREANDKTRAPKSKTLATAPTPTRNSIVSPKTWVWLIVIFSVATAVWLARRWKL